MSVQQPSALKPSSTTEEEYNLPDEVESANVYTSALRDDTVPEGEDLELMLNTGQYSGTQDANDTIPHYHYLEEIDGQADHRYSEGPVFTLNDDKVLVKGENDLKMVKRLMLQFDSLRREIQLPIMDSILLEKYILDPVEETVGKSVKYYAKRRAVAAQLCRDMPAIAAAAASASEPDIEGGSNGLAGGLSLEAFQQEIDRSAGKPPMPITRRRVVGALVKTVNLLSDHKQATLEVLEVIARRERAFEDTLRIATANERGDLHDIVAAVEIHASLFELQKASLLAVERIRLWREGLCMPHPFTVANGDNYILKMYKDCNILSEHLVVQKMLPMQQLIADYPLFTNVPLISRYVVEKEENGLPFMPIGAPPLDLRLHNRLQQAEAYMHSEIELQLAMVRAQLTMAGRSELLPIINISPVCPILKEQQKDAAEKLRKTEVKIKPLRVCVPIGASTVGSSPKGNPTSANVDPASHVGQSVLKFTKGIRIASQALRDQYETMLLAYFDILKNPPCREAYDRHCKENHRQNTAGKTFKVMRERQTLTAGSSDGRRYTSTPSNIGLPLTPHAPLRQ